MARREVCGNDYAMSFEIDTIDGDVNVFESFECAVHRMASICKHCKCRVIGHGVEANGHFYCCAHCAHAEGRRLSSITVPIPALRRAWD